ncbi:28453_t:CDS:1, partial [Dentiscutata erythropus]
IVLMIVHVVWNGIITIEWDDKRENKEEVSHIDEVTNDYTL